MKLATWDVISSSTVIPKVSLTRLFIPRATVSVLCTYLLTYGAVNCAAPQEIPSILWNPKVQYRVQKSPPLVPILSHIDPIHSIPSYLSKIHFNIVYPPTLGLPSGLFPSGFPTSISELCVSEKFKRIGNGYNSRPIFKTESAHERRERDRQQTAHCIYSISLWMWQKLHWRSRQTSSRAAPPT
jgi:hypothetical protein